MEDYVQFGYSIGVDMSVGFLYTKINENRARFPDKLTTGYVNARFRFYLEKVGMDNNNQGDLKLSIHSLRAGSAITKILQGQSLKKVMYVRCVLEEPGHCMEVPGTLPGFISFQGFWCTALSAVARKLCGSQLDTFDPAESLAPSISGL